MRQSDTPKTRGAPMSGKTVGDLLEPKANDGSYRCVYCGEVAPHGDERWTWLSWHDSLLHRFFCWVKGPVKP